MMSKHNFKAVTLKQSNLCGYISDGDDRVAHTEGGHHHPHLGLALGMVVLIEQLQYQFRII